MLSIRTRTGRRSLQEGQAIVLIALLILVLFGMLGLAIDSGRGYVDRRDQQTAVDAAALAAGDWYENFPDNADLFAKVIPHSIAVYEANLRIYTGTDSAPFPSSTPIGAGLTQDQWTMTFLNGAYSLKIQATNTQFNGYQFYYESSHSLPLTFIQVFGGSPTISIGATATAIVGNQRQTPALLTLDNGPCSTHLQGAGTLTILGDAYTNGQACVDANLHLAGNCYAASGNCSAASFWCYSTVAGTPPYDPQTTGGSCLPGDLQGAPYVPAPSLPDPGYLSPYAGSFNTAGNIYGRGSWNEMTPGTYNNFSISSNGCYFLDPGVYTWNGGYSSHGALLSNELKPPTEVLWSSPGTGTTPSASFWGSQNCDGTFSVAAVPAGIGTGIKKGGPGTAYWGIELTSVRYDRFIDPALPCFNGAGCRRESAPSICQQVGTLDGNNQGIAVTVTQNAPGAQYYAVYVNPNGCIPYPGGGGGTRNDFSYAGDFIAPGWIDGGGPPASTLGLGPWSGVLTQGRGGWGPACSNPLITLCGFQQSQLLPTAQCPFYNPLTTKCRAPWDEATPQCFLTCGAGTVPQDNSPMTLQYAPYNGGDLANENLCQQTPPAGSGDPNQPCTAAKVTPGAVQFYFPVGNNCLDQNGNGSTHVFSGEQYNWIVIYQVPSTPGTPANTYCLPNQKLNGSALTQYIGTIYSPTNNWDILGSDTSPLAGQVICWQATVAGSGNAGIDFNPNYSPAPPAARLIN